MHPHHHAGCSTDFRKGALVSQGAVHPPPPIGRLSPPSHVSRNLAPALGVGRDRRADRPARARRSPSRGSPIRPRCRSLPAIAQPQHACHQPYAARVSTCRDQTPTRQPAPPLRSPASATSLPSGFPLRAQCTRSDRFWNPLTHLRGGAGFPVASGLRQRRRRRSK